MQLQTVRIIAKVLSSNIFVSYAVTRLEFGLLDGGEFMVRFCPIHSLPYAVNFSNVSTGAVTIWRKGSTNKSERLRRSHPPAASPAAGETGRVAPFFPPPPRPRL